MQSLKQMRLVCAVTSSMIGSMLALSPALAETGTLGNTLDFPVTYETAVPDAQGNYSWESHTLQPCETHEWSWDRGGPPNIHFIWPRWRDERRDEYGNILKEHNVIPMNNAGVLTVFFPFGEQIWIDSSGAATMDACESPTPPPPSPTPPNNDLSGGQVSISDIDDLIARAERGEVLLVDNDSFNNLEYWQPKVMAVTLEDLAILLFIAASLQDPDNANAHMVQIIRSITLQSKALIEVLRADRDAMFPVKN